MTSSTTSPSHDRRRAAGGAAATARRSVEVTQAYLDRIAAEDGAARRLPARRPRGRAARGPPRSTPPATAGTGLAGVPVALKDVVVTEGVPTTSGSKILEGWRPPYDATVAARLKAAGTVLLGKTNMDEFAMGSSTENSAYRRHPQPVGPRAHPRRLLRRLVGGGRRRASRPWAIGTDTGGSIRQPAALTGLVGHKPTYGSVSRYGLIAFSSSLDQAGPMARTVLDAALLHEAIGGHDPLDSTSIDAPVPVLAECARRGADGDLSGLKVGVVRELGGEGHTDGYEAGVLARVAEAVALLEGMGAEVREVSCPAFDLALAAYYLIAPERGVVQPGPLRRRPVRPAGRRRRQPRPRRGHGAHPRAGLRPRGEAPDHPRHLRAVQRLLRGLLRPGAEGAHADQPRLRRRRSTRRRRAGQPDHPDRRLPARRPRRRPDRHVRRRPLHAAGQPGRASRPSRCRAGSPRGCRSGFQIMAPALADDRCYRVAAALEAARTTPAATAASSTSSLPRQRERRVNGALKAAWALTAFVDRRRASSAGSSPAASSSPSSSSSAC